MRELLISANNWYTIKQAGFLALKNASPNINLYFFICIYIIYIYIFIYIYIYILYIYIYIYNDFVVAGIQRATGTISLIPLSNTYVQITLS